MKRSVLFCFSLLMALTLNGQQSSDNSVFYPKASDGAEVVYGKARFTILTPRLIRMEWSEDSKFEDRATLGVVNRKLEVPYFKVKETRSKITIKTSEMTLVYEGSDRFSKENLSVTFKMTGSGNKTVTWYPGMEDSANLLGTARTLDHCKGDLKREVYDKGVLSRDGWAVLDESTRHVFRPVENDWKYWAANRPRGERQDLYFFGYGHDYTEALSDFVKISGKIPLPPKYTFGYWWSRWWEYSDFELIDLAEHFKSYNIPIDVMIIDMDWHETWTEIAAAAPARNGKGPGRDDFGQRIGWSGFTWKKELFPNPSNTMSELHRRGIRTSLNLHFNNGIQPYEEPYERFVKDYLSRTSKYDGPEGYVFGEEPHRYRGYKYTVGEPGKKAPVAFRMCQLEWADAFFNSVIHPLEKAGVDFWWLDWQQWKASKYMKGLNNTFWLNYTFFNDKVRQSASLGIHAPRPMIYHRWGGIGSHRYQVGFSGDTYATWKVLAFLPYFTATASNVGYGYWGHDIGGFYPPKDMIERNPELYTRWIQAGVFTPIFKTHSTKKDVMEKRFWVFPEHFDAMKNAVRLRYDLSPYIYTAARQAYETGISMARGLYYYWPEEDKAYERKEEFMFGDDILATVVCNPTDSLTGLAERSMWFPEGTDWYDVSTGKMYKGGSEHTLLYTINENPYFIKAGAVIPMAGPDIMNLQEQSPEIRLFVVPGLGESRTSIYEDDGESQAYVSEYAVTEVVKNTGDKQVTIKVSPRKGSFKGMLENRRVSLILDGFFAPSKVTVNGVDVPYSRFASYESKDGRQVWGYNGNQLQVIVYLEELPAVREIDIVCTFDVPVSSSPDGRKGLVNRMMALTPEAKLKFSALKIKNFQLPSEFMDIAQCGSYITEDPVNAVKFLEAMDVKAMIDNLNSWEKLSSDFKVKVAAQTVFEK